MKKIFAFTLLLIALAATPAIIGNIAHTAYQRSIDNIPLDAGSIQITEQAYEKSWFTSMASSELRLNSNDPAINAITMTIHSNIQHGPLLFSEQGLQFGIALITSTATINGLAEPTQALVDRYIKETTITDVTFIDFQQKAHDRLHIQPIKGHEGGVDFAFGGLTLEMTSPLDYSRFSGQYTLLASEIQQHDQSMKLSGAAGSFNFQLFNNEFILGQSKINIPELTLSDGNITLQGINFQSDSSQVQSRLNFSESLSVEKIDMPMPINALQYSITLEQLDPKALALWAEFSQSFANDSQASIIDNPHLGSLLAAVFQPETQLNQRLRLDAKGGSLNIDNYARYVPLADGRELIDLLGKEALIRVMDVQLQASLDQGVVQNTPIIGGVLSWLMGQGLVEQRGEKLLADAQLNNGTLSVNGHQLPIDWLYPLLAITPTEQ